MSIVETPTLFRPEDLLTLPDGDLYELIDGQLVEKAMSTWSNYVAGVIFSLLQDFCRPRALGWVFPEGTTYQCFPNHPLMVRKADVSFIRLDRLSLEDAHAEGHLRIAPDLAVEVLSPKDLVYKVDRKIQSYREAGVRLIWVVNPETHTVEVHRPGGVPGLILHDTDQLEGEDVIPGFRCRVADLFRPPAETP